jgi:hypothetical protein
MKVPLLRLLTAGSGTSRRFAAQTQAALRSCRCSTEAAPMGDAAAIPGRTSFVPAPKILPFTARSQSHGTGLAIKTQIMAISF